MFTQSPSRTRDGTELGAAQVLMERSGCVRLRGSGCACASQTKRARRARGESEGSSRQPPPRTPSGSDPSYQQIRDSEDFVLNAWSSEKFTKVGLLATVLLLVFFVVVIGPPPSDGRCTLPWC